MYWGSGSSPEKSYSKDLWEGVNRVIFRPQTPIAAFLDICCVKSLRAITLRSASRSDEPYFTQQTGGLTLGITLRRMQHTTSESGSVVARIYWAIA